MGKAPSWATVVWYPLSSYNGFVEHFQQVLDHTLEGKEIIQQLLTIMQGKRNASEYALEFCVLAVGSGLNDLALRPAFHQGLNPEVLTELAYQGDKVTLDSLIDTDPRSRGNTAVICVIDQFLKCPCLVLLPSLLTTFESSDLIILEFPNTLWGIETHSSPVSASIIKKASSLVTFLRLMDKSSGSRLFSEDP